MSQEGIAHAVDRLALETVVYASPCLSACLLLGIHWLVFKALWFLYPVRLLPTLLQVCTQIIDLTALSPSNCIHGSCKVLLRAKGHHSLSICREAGLGPLSASWASAPSGPATSAAVLLSKQPLHRLGAASLVWPASGPSAESASMLCRCIGCHVTSTVSAVHALPSLWLTGS